MLTISGTYGDIPGTAILLSCIYGLSVLFISLHNLNLPVRSHSGWFIWVSGYDLLTSFQFASILQMNQLKNLLEQWVYNIFENLYINWYSSCFSYIWYEFCNCRLGLFLIGQKLIGSYDTMGSTLSWFYLEAGLTKYLKVYVSKKTKELYIIICPSSPLQSFMLIGIELIG